MVSLLWIEGSPKGEHSLSSACVESFVEGIRGVRDDVTVTRRNVWDDDVLAFGREAVEAKFGPLFGDPHTPEQTAIWGQVEAEIEKVADHDHLLLSTPMWNWHLPWALKAWIDVIVQPLSSFTLDREGRHVGVLGVGKRMTAVFTRSSAYDDRHPELIDHQGPYVRYLFEMLGFEVDEPLVVEPTTAWTSQEREAIAEDAITRSQRAGRAWAEVHLA